MIVVTVRHREEAEERAQQLGAAGYVQKPVNVDELITSLQQVLAHRS